MTSVRLNSTLGTYVTQGLPSQNNDASARLYARNWSGAVVYSYIYFAIPFKPGNTIQTAKLHVYAASDKTVAGSITGYLKRLKETVTYTKVAWNSRATTFYSTTEASVTKASNYTSGEEWVFDITSDMQAVAGSSTVAGDKWYGYQLRTNWTNTAFNPSWFSPQSGAPTLRPWVEITWSDAPDIPTRLVPADGGVVSTPTPILRFDYTDLSGDTDLTNVQVQVSTSTSFTSPAYDSGVVAADSPQYDLTGLFTMTSNVFYYWRVRVQDGAGLWGGWSTPEQMKYLALPTLSVDNPAVSPDNYVEEPTPPINWTVTGGTQTAYQLGLWLKNDSGPDSGPKWAVARTASTTVNSVRIPDNKMTLKDSTYRIDVRIYDGVANRQAVPNGAVYQQISRYFTYNYSALTTSVTNLTASALDPKPGVKIEWDRGTAPDSFSVTRDSVVIASNLAAADLLVSGTHYAWTDTKPVKEKSHVYSVQAVVNGKASASNPTVTQKNSTVGTFLTALDGSNLVCMINDRERTLTFGEQSATYEVLGSTRIDVVTQSQRGWEGQIKGELHSGIPGFTETADTFKTRLLNLKSYAGQQCLLFIQTATFPVVIANVQCSPKPQPGPTVYEVSFNFYQQGDLGYTPRL